MMCKEDWMLESGLSYEESEEEKSRKVRERAGLQDFDEMRRMCLSTVAELARATF